MPGISAVYSLQQFARAGGFGAWFHTTAYADDHSFYKTYPAGNWQAEQETMFTLSEPNKDRSNSFCLTTAVWEDHCSTRGYNFAEEY